MILYVEYYQESLDVELQYSAYGENHAATLEEPGEYDEVELTAVNATIDGNEINIINKLTSGELDECEEEVDEDFDEREPDCDEPDDWESDSYYGE